jgi:hypothetical protein
VRYSTIPTVLALAVAAVTVTTPAKSPTAKK